MLVNQSERKQHGEGGSGVEEECLGYVYLIIGLIGEHRIKHR
jgi:hypothetical protein